MDKQRLKELALSASEEAKYHGWQFEAGDEPLLLAAVAEYIAAAGPETVLALLEEPKTVFAVYECGFDFYEDRALFMTREAAEEYIRKSTEGISPDLVALEIEERPVHSSAQEALEAEGA